MSVAVVDAVSAVKEVTVYENRAQVHRHATVSLEVGVNSVVFADLPRDLDRESLQVGFAAAVEGVTLRGLQFDSRTRPNPEYEAAMADKDSDEALLERLKGELITVRDDLEAVRRRQAQTAKQLARATSLTSGTGPAVFDPATWESVLGAYGTSFEAELREQRRLEDAQEALAKEQAAAEQRRRIPVPRELNESVVTVLLSAAAVVKAELVVSYLVSGASWESEYEVRVKSDTLEMAVHYHGVVKQRTAEDWRDARISLSTARPSISGRQPELTPWRVGIYVAPPRAQLRSFSRAKCSAPSSSAYGGGGGDERCMQGALNDELDELECHRDIAITSYAAPVVETAAVSEAATSVSFTVPRLMTILRDGEPCRAALQTLTFPVTLSHVTAPSALEAVFASAKAVNKSDVPLAAGSASVFLDGQFVTRSALPRTPIGDELEVSVGRDEGVSVKRKMLNKKRSDEGGMWSGRRDLLTYTYESALKNGRRRAVDVKVQERIPCSNDDDLVVTLVKPDPSTLSEEAKKKLKDDGILEVQLSVAPNTTSTFALEFTVSAPEGRTVYGL